MNGLIEHIESNDPDFVTLTLTMECETFEELQSLKVALEANTTLRQVAFRESFFPLRNIRRHLPWHLFLEMLEVVGTKAVEYLYLPPTMMGMLRGQTACHLLFENNASLQEFRAHESITFGSLRDVEDLAECLGECQDLRVVELGDSFLNRSSRRDCEYMMDTLLLALAELPHLQTLELSSHYEQHQSARSPALLSPDALQHFLVQSSPHLQLLNLSRLGLGNDHFEAIANYFATSSTPTEAPTHSAAGDAPTKMFGDIPTNEQIVEEEIASSSSAQHVYLSEEPTEQQQRQAPPLLRLCLDGNRPTKAGATALFQALRHNPPVQSISLRGIPNISARLIPDSEWSDNIFAGNFHLNELEVDGHDNVSLLGGSTNNGGGRDVVEFWTKLNGLTCGNESLGQSPRQYWQETAADLNIALWPLILEQVSLLEESDASSFVWYVLRNFVQYVILPS